MPTTTIADIRKKYPQYNDLSDAELADRMHRKFYSDMPREEFDKRIGMGGGQKPGTLYDMARSAASGVRSGVEGLAGMIGDAQSMQGDLVSWGAKMLGASPETQATAGNIGRLAFPMPPSPTTGQIKGVTDAVIGERYQPQTTAGKYARTVGEFAPGAAAMPGGVIRKSAMAVVPGLMSEAAGQMTEGSEAEPYARLAGGVAGGLLAAGRRPSLIREAARGAPTREAAKQQTNLLYDTMRKAGIRYDANAYDQMVRSIAGEFHKKGLRPAVAQKAFSLLDDLAKDVGKSPDFDDINSLIQTAGRGARDAAAAKDGNLELAMNIIRDKLDDFERMAVMVSNKPMPKDTFDFIRKAARKSALRNIKQRALDEVVRNAETMAGGQEAGIRNGIRTLLRSRRGNKMFSEAERKALLDVANGRKPLQTLSRFGFDLFSLSGNATFLPTIGALGAGAGFGAPAGVGLAVAGTGAKIASPLMTNRAMENAASAIRSGGLTNPNVLNKFETERLQYIVRHLLNAESAKNSANLPVPAR